MTDEQLSELAEAMADACSEWQMVSSHDQNSWCPLGVLFPHYGPRPNSARLEGLLDHRVARGFAFGFDGNPVGCTQYDHLVDRRAYELGKLFRELYP